MVLGLPGNFAGGELTNETRTIFGNYGLLKLELELVTSSGET